MTDKIDDTKPLTDDETATMQAAGGAAGTGAASNADKNNASSSSVSDAEMKGWIRANARWLMAELDWTRAGRRADERETLNP